jgi:serine/threonine protein kinase/DNA-binding NarL/FixJ family response regulator/tetratricopeptide (TPR) repeat protein
LSGSADRRSYPCVQVLLIEKDPETISVISTFLSEIPECRLRNSTSYADALLAILEKPPNLILFTDGLPGRNSLEVFASIRNKYPSIYLLVTLPEVNRDLSEEYKKAGAADCIIKDKNYLATLEVHVKKTLIQILSASASEKTPLLSAEESDSSDPLTSMLSALEPGDKILHYEIIDAIGEGGMGEVYKAQDLKLRRTVAIKVLPLTVSNDAKARRRFVREAQSASRLNHSGIVTIHAIEEIDDVQFIVMEYLEGQSLRAVLEQGPLELNRLIRIGSQIAEALEAAHSAGLIHRDIKPANIMITSQDKVKILDFGLAKAISEINVEDALLTAAGAVVGTVHYMSPEQTRGETLDAQTDLFSLGSVLYYAATGSMPFRGANIASTMYQIAHAPVPPPSSLRSELPAEFDAIVMHALAKEKHLRYGSAAEVATHLRSLSYPVTEKLFPVVPSISAAGKRECFVGRQKEIVKLQQHFVSVQQHSGKTVFLIGEAGIGKTELAKHFLETILLSYPETSIVSGRCVEQYGTGEAYLPFLDGVGAILNGPSKDQVTQVLRSHAPAWCMQFPSAFTATGVLENSQKEAAAASKERMQRELSDAMIELAREIPLIIFLEDLQWADPSTADLLRYLARRIQGQKLMILGTMREEDLEAGNPSMKACRLDLQEHSLNEEIRLNVLPEIQVREYLDLLHSPNSFPEDFASMIFRKTEGHPLFLTSLLQFLVNQKIIGRQNQVWILTKTLSEMDLDVPGNVQSMIRRKMEALREEDRKVLQYAAIEGTEFSSTVLSELLGTDEIDLEEQLSRIEKKYRFILKTGEDDWPDGTVATTYRFVHALYQNGFYSDLVTKRKIQLHRSAATSLKKHYGDKAHLIANKLGSHFRIGRDAEKAVQYLALAGDQANKMYANSEAVQLYNQALLQLEDLLRTDHRTWKTTAASLHEKRADSLFLLGKHPEAKQQYEAALSLVDSSLLLDVPRIYRKIANTVEAQRDFNPAIELYKKAESLLENNLENQSVDWQREWLQVYLERSWLYYRLNLQQEMQTELSIMEPFVQRIGTPSQRLRYYQNSIFLACRTERYRMPDHTLALVDLSLKAAVETGIASDLAQVHFLSGFCHLWRGNLELAEKYLNNALSEAMRLEDVVLQSRCVTYLTILHRKRGDTVQTKVFAESSLDLAFTLNLQEYIATAKANQAWLGLRAHQFEEAKRFALDAIRIWQSVVTVAPLQELAVWPLIRILLSSKQISEACEYAKILLQPAQRKLDPEIEELLQLAVKADEEGDSALAEENLMKSTNIVEIQGYV